MTFNFNSSFGQRLLARILQKVAKRKLGCDVDAQIADLQLYETVDDKHVCLSVNLKLSVAKNDVDKLIDHI